jgi:hypothetical protein
MPWAAQACSTTVIQLFAGSAIMVDVVIIG